MTLVYVRSIAMLINAYQNVIYIVFFYLFIFHTYLQLLAHSFEYLPGSLFPHIC